jgi:hypothetical protein
MAACAWREVAANGQVVVETWAQAAAAGTSSSCRRQVMAGAAMQRAAAAVGTSSSSCGRVQAVAGLHAALHAASTNMAPSAAN